MARIRPAGYLLVGHPRLPTRPPPGPHADLARYVDLAPDADLAPDVDLAPDADLAPYADVVTPGMTGVTVRRAVPADAAELTRLRVVLFDSIDMERPPPAWWVATERVFAERLATESTFAAFVVDDPDHPNRLLASAVGWVELHLPSTRTLSPLIGRIVSVCTDVPARGRGYGRAVVAAILTFLADHGASHVDLQSTDVAEKLYRSLGFADAWGIGLSLRTPRLPATAVEAAYIAYTDDTETHDAHRE